MNLPGDPALALRDIHAAPPPGLWPPAPGWWVLAILLLILLVLGAQWLRRRYRARRFLHNVMLELDSITDRYKTSNEQLVAALCAWLRRVALQRYPQEEVASLTGAAWLAFLDATGGAGEFRNGVGKVLETGPYRSGETTVAVDALLTLVRHWGIKNLEAQP